MIVPLDKDKYYSLHTQLLSEGEMCPWEVGQPQTEFICGSKPASGTSLWMDYPSGYLLVGQCGFKCTDGNFSPSFALPRGYLPASASPVGATEI